MSIKITIQFRWRWGSESSFYFVRYEQNEMCLNVRWLFFQLAYNEPRIGDSGGLENLNFQSCTYLSNSLLLFSKFMKKGNIKDCCDKKKEKLSISPLNRHFANAMLSAVLL